jgi:hypothetical protein
MNVMAVAFKDWDFHYIEKATLHFIQNDSKGFPPVPGQLIALAQDIKAAEIRKRQIEASKLPEPPGIPMPDELREKFNAMLDRMKVRGGNYD